MQPPTEWQVILTNVALAISTTVNLINMARIVHFYWKHIQAQELTERQRGPCHSSIPLALEYKRWFVFLSGLQVFFAITTGWSFAILTWQTWRDGGNWAIFLLASIVVSSMIKESLWMSGFSSRGQHYYIPVPLAIVLAVTCISYIVNSILEFKFGRVRNLPVLSILAFRLWVLVEEQTLFLSAESSHLVALKCRTMVCFLASMVSITGFQVDTSLDRHLVLANTLASYDLLLHVISLFIYQDAAVQVLKRLCPKLFTAPRVFKRRWKRPTVPNSSSEIELRRVGTFDRK